MCMSEHSMTSASIVIQESDLDLPADLPQGQNDCSKWARFSVLIAYQATVLYVKRSELFIVLTVRPAAVPFEIL